MREQDATENRSEWSALRQRVADLEAVEIECRQAQEELQRANEIQGALNALLRLSLEEASLHQLLEDFLDVLLNVSWMKTLPRGGIFLVEDRPDVLVLRVSRNLEDSIRHACARVPFGRCLCGRAAETRRIQVAHDVGLHHDIDYPGRKPHGHYNVPIVSDGEVLGVIVLYLPEGQGGDPYELLFLEATANALAGLIKRKRAEEALKDSEGHLRSLMENAREFVFFRISLDQANPHVGRVVFVSPSIETVIGASDSMNYETWFANLHPDDLEGRKRTGLPVLLTLKPLEEVRFYHPPTATWRWIQWITTQLPSSDGRWLYVDGILMDITGRKASEEKIQRYQSHLRQLASELSMTEARERRRIATDIHDRIGQILYFSRMKLDALTRGARDSDLTGKLKDIEALLDQAANDVRMLILDISPPILHELGLKAAVRWLVDKIKKEHDIAVELVDDGQPKPLSEDVRDLLFRAVRELAMNVIKHSKARKMAIVMGRTDRGIEVAVRDDGVGFSACPAQDAGGFGLFSIHERLRALGGRLEVASTPGEGACVTLIIPPENDKAR